LRQMSSSAASTEALEADEGVRPQAMQRQGSWPWPRRVATQERQAAGSTKVAARSHCWQATSEGEQEAVPLAEYGGAGVDDGGGEGLLQARAQ
jgi:hypothetical protein